MSLALQVAPEFAAQFQLVMPKFDEERSIVLLGVGAAAGGGEGFSAHVDESIA